jgi:hypothetical protein
VRPAGGIIAALLAAVLTAAGAAAPSTAVAGDTPLCLGAQALDPARTCTVGPRRITRNLFAGRVACRPMSGPSAACRFGVAPSRARRTIALLGDSHAEHWLAALDGMARTRRWTGVALTAPGCFFSEAVHALPDGPREPCTQHYDAVRRYLRRHPTISTVLASSSLLQAVQVPSGQTLDQVRQRGFEAAYRALPASVRRLVVIRDPPINSPAQFACVRGAVARGADPNAACPLPRSAALQPDPSVAAVEQLRSRRYRSVDLSDFFCPGEACLSVVGGVQVYRDAYGHLTDLYSSSLGPYLRRAVERVLGWRR